MKKVMIAVSDGYGLERAAAYVKRQFAGATDLAMTLVHVLPDLPAMYWDEGHILTDIEEGERQKVIDTWLTRQQEKIEPVMRAAIDDFVAAGFEPGQFTTKFISGSPDVADSLLKEARDGGYLTMIMGRRGTGDGRHLFIGSVTNRVFHDGAGVAITIVE